jgi:hypothetical protein
MTGERAGGLSPAALWFLVVLIGVTVCRYAMFERACDTGGAAARCNVHGGRTPDPPQTWPVLSRAGRVVRIAELLATEPDGIGYNGGVWDDEVGDVIACTLPP